MKIAWFCIPAHGHTNPTLGIVKALTEAGHEVWYFSFEEFRNKVENAGAIFMGPYSSEPLGDYFAGPNHILPTGGTARFFSPLGVDTFVKKSSLISYSKEALGRIHEEIELFAESEGLTAHANSIKVRFDR